MGEGGEGRNKSVVKRNEITRDMADKWSNRQTKKRHSREKIPVEIKEMRGDDE